MIGSLFLNKTYSRSELRGLLEAILFVNGKAIPIEELKKMFEMDEPEMMALIEEANAFYKQNTSGFHILPMAGGWQMVTNPHYKDELNEVFGRRNDNKLPKSVLETLAVIAYKQPVSKEEVDKIRGVSSSRSINMLLALKLATISGATDDMIKSPLYSTTDRFLEFFRIRSLEDLPPLSSIDLSRYRDEDDSASDDDTGEDPKGGNEAGGKEDIPSGPADMFQNESQGE
jgi:segregation and condensation protein B